MLLLDTHTWIWFVQGNEKIKKPAIQIIEEAIKTRTLFIAAISQWEVAMLIDKSRIVLNEPALNWVTKAIEELHIKVLPLSTEVAVESSQLPGEFHGDPTDRMIVATARLHHLTLLTRDEKMLRYSAAKHVKAMEI